MAKGSRLAAAGAEAPLPDQWEQRQWYVLAQPRLLPKVRWCSRKAKGKVAVAVSLMGLDEAVLGVEGYR
ncbi:MAG: hypothetical protein C4K60_05480 [Ideonella sp. MAG2]|nr:MAG: hypothetical protein C4K60_05480 [Ideonella sp. MAG2]